MKSWTIALVALVLSLACLALAFTAYAHNRPAGSILLVAALLLDLLALVQYSDYYRAIRRYAFRSFHAWLAVLVAIVVDALIASPILYVFGDKDGRVQLFVFLVLPIALCLGALTIGYRIRYGQWPRKDLSDFPVRG